MKNSNIPQIPSKIPPVTTIATPAVFLAPAPPTLTSEESPPAFVLLTPTVAVSITARFTTPTFFVYVGGDGSADAAVGFAAVAVRHVDNAGAADGFAVDVPLEVGDGADV